MLTGRVWEARPDSGWIIVGELRTEQRSDGITAWGEGTFRSISGNEEVASRDNPLPLLTGSLLVLHSQLVRAKVPSQ